MSWESAPQPSRFAIVNNYFDVRPQEAPGSVSVIDGIKLNPSTANINFNVYYTTEGEASAPNTTEEWEKKLWKRVPKIFKATTNQEYVLPAPIAASYVKIEYTNLMPKSYKPSNMQFPVLYKKFPVWVAEYFLDFIEQPEFGGVDINVRVNTLDLLYNYYLDDLNQSPAKPIIYPEHKTELLENIKEYLYIQKDKESKKVSSQVLDRIQTYNRPYSNNLGLAGFADPKSMLGMKNKYEEEQYHSNIIESLYAPEYGEIQYTSVLNKNRLVEEETMPPMYFYKDCRHEYKENAALFEYEKAYFAGINEIKFLRHSYEVSYDAKLYIENGADSHNTEENDFIINEDGSWSVD